MRLPIFDTVVDLAKVVLERVFPNPADKAKSDAILEEIKLRPDLAQLAINLEEAKSDSIFKSGWRPFAGWGVTLSFVGGALMETIIKGIWQMCHGMPPNISLYDISALLFGMLGMSWVRNKDKEKEREIIKKYQHPGVIIPPPEDTGTPKKE
jgi:hypothetical protein